VSDEDLTGVAAPRNSTIRLPSGIELRRGSFNINPEVLFQAQRSALPAAERVAWRLSMLILILSKFRGRRSSVENLHLIFWGMRTRATRALLSSWWKGLQPPDLATTKSEPTLDVTISLAAAEDLVSFTAAGKVALTDHGVRFAALLESEDDVMQDEKALLTELGLLGDAAILRHLGPTG
jgi:hypothetical protein